ncbi:hypothetical protein, partial [Salinispora arenicola]|uniref:hypothetical protein n=1 Tax=Salinispora arenicola TaxID=168697 RepID=UPI0027DE671C
MAFVNEQVVDAHHLEGQAGVLLRVELLLYPFLGPADGPFELLDKPLLASALSQLKSPLQLLDLRLQVRCAGTRRHGHLLERTVSHDDRVPRPRSSPWP